MAHPFTGNRYLTSLSYPDFRRLFLSTSAAGLANWTLIVARGWLAYKLTGSPTWVGFITFGGMLPFMLGPLGGVLADRHDRRKLAAASTAAGALFSLLLALLTIAGMVEVWQLAALTIVMSIPRAAELPARQAMISNTVPPENLVNAVALSSVATFGTRAVGPALVIPMIGTMGVEGVFLLAAAFYMASTITALRVLAGHDVEASRRLSARENLLEGMRYIAATRTVSSLMLLVMCHCALTMSFDSLLPVFAAQQLSSGGASFSALAMGVGLGALVGTLFVSGLRDDSAKGAALLATGLLSGVTPLAMALPMSMMNLAAAVSSTAAMGATQGAFMALAGALIQAEAPDELRGRVTSIYLLFAGGLMAWMNLINGALADVWDVPILFAAPAVAFICLLALLTLWLPSLRGVFRHGTLAARPQPVLATIA